jgi:hypothetical protein
MALPLQQQDDGGRHTPNEVDDRDNFTNDSHEDVALAEEQSFETIESKEHDDMESLLPVAGNNNNNNTVGNSSDMTPLEQHMNSALEKSNATENGMHDGDRGRTCIPILPYRVGQVHILFPQFFHTSGWGVLGPHWFGPACVWLILVGASHLCVKAILRRNLGMGSIFICYFFLAMCTYRLTDVSLRDPGVVLDKEIPAHVPPEHVNQYRFCDRCQVWQPPDGVHCPECNVCVAGYDHHCVWMGTCIGKRNYRQFVLFNMSWLYYIGYLFFWILTFGPLIF